jgi:hypothetical protein
MVVLNTWTECMLDDTFCRVLFALTIIVTLMAWAISFKYKDFSGLFPGLLGTIVICFVLWANLTPDTYHIIDVSNASFLEVHNDYIIVSPVEGSSTLYKVKEKIHEPD